MEFYNNYYWNGSFKTMALYDQTEPLQQPIGFVHFADKAKGQTVIVDVLTPRDLGYSS